MRPTVTRARKALTMPREQMSPVDAPPDDPTPPAPPSDDDRRGFRWRRWMSWLAASRGRSCSSSSSVGRSIQLPYYTISPGSALNLLGTGQRQASRASRSTARRRIRPTTRSCCSSFARAQRVNVWEWIQASVDPDIDLFKEPQFTGGLDPEEVRVESDADMAQSQLAAKKVALEAAGYTVPGRQGSHRARGAAVASRRRRAEERRRPPARSTGRRSPTRTRSPRPSRPTRSATRSKSGSCTTASSRRSRCRPSPATTASR